MKKTFSKKRNQRRAVYAGSAVIIVSLLFGLRFSQVQAAQDKHELYQMIQEKDSEKRKQLQKLTQGLEELKKQKAVTDTQLQEKADSEAQKQSEIDKLKAELQAKADEETATQVAVAPVQRTGGMGGDSSGNLYDYGYCTWYVKNRRPDIPNNWGDAWEWLGNAQAIGWATGSIPKAGAVGQTTSGGLGHVVYVESVNDDGTVNISEMNSVGWNQVDYKTVASSTFNYIY